jgi:hypothetical protein
VVVCARREAEQREDDDEAFHHGILTQDAPDPPGVVGQGGPEKNRRGSVQTLLLVLNAYALTRFANT